MEKAKKENRKFIRICSVFVVLLIVLTFFSKSFYNYRLPEVTVADPKQGGLAFTVEGISEINYSHINSVYAQIDGRVVDISVACGEGVSKGQCIMKFQTADSEELTEIVAESEGIITLIGVKNGMYVSSMQNTILYEIAEPSKGLVCTLFMTEEQSENITTESSSTVELSDTGERLKSEIKGIVSYADQSKSGYLAEILLDTEDSELAGRRVNVEIKRESEVYDTLIPVSALHKDSVGYYVLILKKEDSVLGNGFAVQRMSVELLDSDAQYCAVRGLPNDEKVVVAATSEITDGNKVYYGGGDE